jgi:hypothetical protein
VKSLRVDSALHPDGPLSDSASLVDRDVFSEKTFKRMIAIERKRTERSNEPFLLMLVEIGEQSNAKLSSNVFERMSPMLINRIRPGKCMVDGVYWAGVGYLASLAA